MIERDITPKRSIATIPFTENGGPTAAPSTFFKFDTDSVLLHISSHVNIGVTAGAVAAVAGGLNITSAGIATSPYSKLTDAVHYYVFGDSPATVAPAWHVFEDRTDMGALFVKAGTQFNVWVTKGAVGNSYITGAFLIHYSTASEWRNFYEPVRTHNKFR